jgi:uncharacterized protein
MVKITTGNTAKGKTAKSKTAKITTSIPKLDNSLGGGIKPESLTCFWIDPGVDNSAFLYQVANGAAKSNKVFYIVNSKSPQSARVQMKELGLKNKINFIDSYSALVGARTSESLLIANPKDSNEILNDISTILKKVKNPVIVLDSLSNLVDLTENESTDFVKKLKELKATVVCSFTEWPYKPAFLASLRKQCDTIIDVKSVQKRMFIRNYFGVSWMDGRNVEQQAIPYRIEKPGGIKIYLPKVLVTGPFNAGKTSFIHSASRKAVSVDRLGTTIALDHGHVEYEDFSVDLFGTPGQQRFDPILKLLGGEALGVIVVVSSIDPQGFPRALEMMKKAKVYGLPVIFAANKANLKGAIKPDLIKKKLKITHDVIPVTAKDLTKVQPGLPCQLKDEDIKSVLHGLFEVLLRGNKDD